MMKIATIYFILFAQILSAQIVVPSLVFENPNPRYNYTLQEVHNENLQYKLYKEKSGRLLSIPLSPEENNLYQLDIDDESVSMRIYFTLPILKEMYKGNQLRDYRDIIVPSINLIKGCFYIDLTDFFLNEQKTEAFENIHDFRIDCEERILSQEPPAVIRFDYTHFASSADELFELYEIRSYAYNNSIPSVEDGHIDLEQYSSKENGNVAMQERFNYKIGTYSINENFLNLFLDGPIPYPTINDVILFSLKKKNKNKYFNVYVRVCQLLEPGQKIKLENFNFTHGNYFFDMCKSNKKYSIDCSNDYEIQIDLARIDTHEVSLKKLNRLIRKHKCI